MSNELAKNFVAQLELVLLPAELKLLGESDDYSANDFCDANMCMSAAWNKTYPDEGFQFKDEHYAIWNQAWSIAEGMISEGAIS